MALRAKVLWIAASGSLLLSTAYAQSWGAGDGSRDGQPGRPPWMDGIDDADGSNDSSSFFNEPFGASFTSGQRALIAHAVIASAVWVILVPLGGILLRLNIKSPWILRVHAALQISSYLLYAAAVGLGIYLIKTTPFSRFTDIWSDAHPRLGLAILALAFFQPILGSIHHVLFKKRAYDTKLLGSDQAPSRTIPGRMHLWLGRSLIVLGIINGGLGIALASRTPFQSNGSTRTAATVYGVVAALMALIYLIIVIRFERRKAKSNEGNNISRSNAIHMEEVPPSYASSQETVQKDHGGVTRYS